MIRLVRVFVASYYSNWSSSIFFGPRISSFQTFARRGLSRTVLLQPASERTEGRAANGLNSTKIRITYNRSMQYKENKRHLFPISIAILQIFIIKLFLIFKKKQKNAHVSTYVLAGNISSCGFLQNKPHGVIEWHFLKFYLMIWKMSRHTRSFCRATCTRTSQNCTVWRKKPARRVAEKLLQIKT